MSGNTNSRGSNADGGKNKMDKSHGKGWSPPSGDQHPPAAGSHKPVGDVHKIDGGYGAGSQKPAQHSSLSKKPGIMRG